MGGGCEVICILDLEKVASTLSSGDLVFILSPNAKMTQYYKSSHHESSYVSGPVLDAFSALRSWQEGPLLWSWHFGGPDLAFLQQCPFSTE